MGKTRGKVRKHAEVGDRQAIQADSIKSKWKRQKQSPKTLADLKQVNSPEQVNPRENRNRKV